MRLEASVPFTSCPFTSTPFIWIGLGVSVISSSTVAPGPTTTPSLKSTE
ncbi:MAG TPA: hypothetical protein VET83_04645 [Candidatus Dormibacteraeota bacterium]|nr:hypothetical protein [Candidatus Dormibacteraeota bacterium]